MIYTVTFNPAIDYVMQLDSLNIGSVNRSQSEKMYFGGKGINVSLVLKELGIESIALGFSAGFIGKAIEEGVSAQGVKTDFIYLENKNSRINVKLKGSMETEINGQGPDISPSEVEQLLKKLDYLKHGDVLVLAGSIPNALPENMYEKIIERLSGKGICFIVDASRNLLMNVLKYKPFLVKPNNYELGEIFDTEVRSKDEAVKYAKKLHEMGAVNVLVSMAGEGAILVCESGEAFNINAPEGKVINSVGAGDSMVAGFIAGYIEKKDYRYALELGTASGSASAFSEGLAKRKEIDKLLEIILMKKI